MASTWIGDGPVSVPPKSLAYTAGGLIAAMAIVGVGMGFRAAWRAPSEPGSASDSTRDAGADGELTAHPIVELPPPVTAASADKDDDGDTNAQAENASIADKSAAAQALQSKPSSPSGNIDDILTSSQEKPPTPVKAPADEAPPTAPVKSDVPF